MRIIKAELKIVKKRLNLATLAAEDVASAFASDADIADEFEMIADDATQNLAALLNSEMED